MSLLRQAIEREFNPRKVGIEEFCEALEFCGKQLYPRQLALLKLFFLEEMTGYEEDVLDEWIRGYGGCQISPYIRERRAWLRENGYQHFPEVLMIGGRRSSKGYITALAMAKLIYDVQQLGDPGAFYGIDPQKEIYFTSVAASLEQAKQYQFADIVSTITQCRALIDNAKVQEEGIFIKTPSDDRLVVDLKSRGVKVGRDYSKLRVKPLAANADTIRGSTTFCIVFDEMAFMLPGESRSSAEQCYQAAKPALAQFGRASMVFLNSSPYTKIGAFFDRAELANETVGQEPKFPEMMAFRFPSWELYRDWDKDPKGRFNRVGAIMVDPAAPDELLTENDKAKKRQAILEEIANPEAFKVERRALWAEVIDAYLNPAMVDLAFAPTYMGKEIKMTQAGTYNLLYKGHCDPSSTTAGFGFAIAHVEEFPDEINPAVTVKHVVFDIVKRWDPKMWPGGTIDYMKVQEEIAQYIALYQPMYEMTFDQFNCLSVGTLITTNRGIIPIQDLTGEMMPGEVRTVPGVSAASSLGNAPISEIYCKGLAETKIFTTKLGYSVECTSEHRLYVRKAKEKPWLPYNDPEWVRAKDIQAGDWLRVESGTLATDLVSIEDRHPSLNRGTQSRYKGVGKMGKRWYAYVRENGRTFRLGWFDEEKEAAACAYEWNMRHPEQGWKVKGYPSHMTEELARICGWVTGEGNVGANGEGKFTNSEPEALEDFAACMKHVFGGLWDPTQACETTSYIQFSALVGRLFQNLGGMDGLSATKRVPDAIWKSPRSVVISFLRALIDGEGGVTNARGNDECLMFHTTSNQLAIEVQQLLLSVGIFSTFWQGFGKWKGERTVIYRVKMFGKDILEFASLIGFISKRKQQALAEVVTQIEARGDRVGLRSKNLRGPGYWWVKVIRVQEGEAVCYDISVPGPEAFLANGIVSHNSVAPIQWLRGQMARRRLRTQVFEKTATKALNWNRWETFKTAVNLGLVHIPADCPDAEYAMLELKFLQDDKGKVVKQELGPVRSKDVADAICECTVSLIGSQIHQILGDFSQNMVMGAQGGWQIGGRNPGGPTNFDEFYQTKKPGGFLTSRGIDPRRRRR